MLVDAGASETDTHRRAPCTRCVAPPPNPETPCFEAFKLSRILDYYCIGHPRLGLPPGPFIHLRRWVRLDARNSGLRGTYRTRVETEGRLG